MRRFRIAIGLASCALVVAAAAFVGCSSEDGGMGTDPSPEAAASDAPSSPDVADGAVQDTDTPEPAFDCTSDSAVEAPMHLRCTGLYDRWTKKTILATVVEYAPGVMLWSDGAEKKRWVLLPAGTKIDTTDMTQWVFPVGTKFWKEFAFGGKRVETRMYSKIGTTTWLRTTYQWSADESSAVRLDTGFSENDAGDPDAGKYEIPSVAKCDTCHAGSTDKILGFEAVSLALPGATGYTLAKLVADGKLTTNPASTSLTIPEDGFGSRNALGWLHANCGTACHNTSATRTCPLVMNLRLSYAELAAGTAVTGLQPYLATVNVGAGIPSGAYKRIAPKSTATSAIHFLASHRNSTIANGQMPPIDTHVIDPTGVGYLSTWINALP